MQEELTDEVRFIRMSCSLCDGVLLSDKTKRAEQKEIAEQIGKEMLQSKKWQLPE